MSSHLFGEHLKREREMRGVSLEEISAATRISVRFLEALEGEQWERLPGGIFNRGFIRSIARFLGLDEEGLVAEYALETRERPEIAIWTKEPVRPRFRWRRFSVAIVFLAFLATGCWFLTARYGAAIRSWHQSHPIFKSLVDRLHRSRPSPPAPPTSSSAAAPGPKFTMNSVSEKAQSQSRKTVQAALPPDAISAAPRTDKSAAPASPSSANSTAPLELKVEAGETSNVTVVADGKAVFSGRLEAMRTLSFRAQKSFTVSSSNSNAVLLELNGRTVPPLGPPGQPGKITLTRENLSSGGQD